MIHALTSVTGSYLANARILARTVREHHPDWRFVLLLNDGTPDGIEWEDEPFDEVVLADSLPIPDFKRWAFDRSVVEVCTGTKPTMARQLLEERGASRVVYLDPDIAVFSPLDEVLQLLETSEVILTPHLTDAEDTEYGVWSHEMAALKHGTFNLGFFAVADRPNGHEFLAWWEDRCLKRGQIDFMNGLFTDQKWCNLAPYLFQGIHVLCDRAYNVATWNMKNREIDRRPEGRWLVNGQPLRFYHFSGFGNDFSWANEELRAFLKESTALGELWGWYKEQYEASRPGEPSVWKWGTFDNGQAVLPEDRVIYREDGKLAKLHPDPYVDAAFEAIRRARTPAPVEPQPSDIAPTRPPHLGTYLRETFRRPRMGITIARRALSVLRREGWRGIRRRLAGRPGSV